MLIDDMARQSSTLVNALCPPFLPFPCPSQPQVQMTAGNPPAKLRAQGRGQGVSPISELSAVLGRQLQLPIWDPSSVPAATPWQPHLVHYLGPIFWLVADCFPWHGDSSPALWKVHTPWHGYSAMRSLGMPQLLKPKAPSSSAASQWQPFWKLVTQASHLVCVGRTCTQSF